jgi:hypothetical protein
MLIEKTGLFTEACRIWRMKPQDTRTYTLCLTYFYEATANSPRPPLQAGTTAPTPSRKLRETPPSRSFLPSFWPSKQRSRKTLSKYPTSHPNPSGLSTRKTWPIAGLMATWRTPSTRVLLASRKGPDMWLKRPERTRWEVVPPSGSRRPSRADSEGRLVASK